MIGKNTALSSLLSIILFSSFILIQNYSFSSGSTVNGLITSDTTWTKANSPYELTGPVGVVSGVTLTIESGVTVNFKNTYIRVNGTLVCRGAAADRITFNGGELQFTDVSTSWNEETGTGSIIEQTQITFVRMSFASPKIVDSSIGEIQINGGAPIIQNNLISGGGGITALSLERNTTAKISNNIIGCSSSESVYIDLYNGKPNLTNNEIAGALQISGYGASSAIITNNKIGASYPGNGNEKASILVEHCSAVISGNHLSGEVFVSGGGQIYGDYSASATITNNVFSGGGIRVDGTATIQNNLIKDVAGPAIALSNYALVENNTLSNNQIGIEVFIDGDYANQQPVVVYNNIIGSTKNSVYLQSSLNFDMPHNWWGTSDSNAIGQSIYDSKNDFNLGTVTFTPFLTEANPLAMPDPNTPILTGNSSPTAAPATQPTGRPAEPTATPTSTDTQKDVLFILTLEQTVIIVLFAAMAVLLVVVGVLLRRRY